jgi:hypothetical protein
MHQLFSTQLLSPNASYKVIKILKHKERDNALGLAWNNSRLVLVRQQSLDDHPLSWHSFSLSIFRFVIRITLRLIQLLSFTSRNQLTYLMGCTMHMYECQCKYYNLDKAT